MRGRTLLREPLFANAGYLLAIEVTNSLVGFLFWGIAAQLYLPGEVGTATAVLSAMALVSGMANLGMANGLIRFLPQTRSEDRLVNTVFTGVALAGLLIGGVFLAGLSVWSPSLVVLQRSSTALAGFLLFSVTMTLNATVRSVFLARRVAAYAFIHAAAVNLVRIPLVATLAGLQTGGLVLSVGIGAASALALSLVVLLPRLMPRYRFRPRLDPSVLASILPFSLGNYVAGLLAQSSRMLLPLVILETLGPVASGHAYIAWMIGTFLTTPGVALAGSAFAEGANAPRDSGRIMAKAAVVGLLLT
ncbi:MAG: lipopolysaccharide biosynthesis protein, partial [Anaerolineae bacterium]